MANPDINLPQGPLPDGDPNNFYNTGWTKEQVKQMAEEDPTFQKFKAKVGQETQFAGKVGAAVGLGIAGSAIKGATSGGSAGGDVDGGDGGGNDDPSSDNPGGDDGSGFDWSGAIKTFGGIAGAVAQFAKQYGQTAIEAIAAYENSQRQQQSDKYAQQGLDLAKQNWADNQPLRDAGRAGMLDPTAKAPDLSSLRNLAGAGSGNPFAGAPIPLSATPKPPVMPQQPRPIPITPPTHTMPVIGQSAQTPAPAGPSMIPLSGQPPTQPPVQPQPPASPIPLGTMPPKKPVQAPSIPLY